MYRSRSLIYLVVHPSPSLFVHNLIVVFGCHFSVVGTQLYQKICILNKIEYYIYYLLITRLSFFNYRVPFLVSVIIYCSHFRLFFFQCTLSIEEHDKVMRRWASYLASSQVNRKVCPDLFSIIHFH